MFDVVWDMETGDPDDYLTLLLLLGHPEVHLKAVTVTPGSPDQIGLVRETLDWFGRDLPVGCKSCAPQVLRVLLALQGLRDVSAAQRC